MASKSKAAAAKETNQKIEAEEEMLTGEEYYEEEYEERPDEWMQEEEMIVPRKPKGEDQQYYVCVNDRRFMIPANGKMQKLPKPIANVLKDSLEAEQDAADYADHIPNKSN